MRVLHLTSDWKWTGPAEPMLSLGQALCGLGVDVGFAYPGGPDGAAQSLAARAQERGFCSVLPLRRGRGLRPIADRADIAGLRAWFRAHRPDVVHCWHTRDHLLALRARGRAGRPALVRSLRRAEPVPRLPWNRWLFGPACDGLLCVSPRSAEQNRSLRGGRPLRGRLGCIDLDRFAPRAVGDGASDSGAARENLGLRPEHRVVGIVARVQPHRRFDLLLAAAARLFERMPAARLLVVGRGTRRQQVAERPAAELGIADRVHFAGYRERDFVAVLRACDVFTYLVPGSDGHCRALLEAQACGIPAVTTTRGALDEIVADGETGLVVPEDPAALASAWERLLRNAALHQRFATAARARAETLFRPESYARETLAFYEEVLSGAPL